MSDHLTVILPPVLSDEERKQAALRSCWLHRLTGTDGTDGSGAGYSWRYGLGSCGDGFGCAWEDGDGFGDGYGDGDGDGESTADIE
jgi:hypothetical protein